MIIVDLSSPTYLLHGQDVVYRDGQRDAIRNRLPRRNGHGNGYDNTHQIYMNGYDSITVVEQLMCVL
jgi:hypothetical protein